MLYCFLSFAKFRLREKYWLLDFTEIWALNDIFLDYILRLEFKKHS